MRNLKIPLTKLHKLFRFSNLVVIVTCQKAKCNEILKWCNLQRPSIVIPYHIQNSYTKDTARDIPYKLYHGCSDDVVWHSHSQQVIPWPTCKPKVHTTCQVIIMLGTSHDEGCWWLPFRSCLHTDWSLLRRAIQNTNYQSFIIQEVNIISGVHYNKTKLIPCIILNLNIPSTWTVYLQQIFLTLFEVFNLQHINICWFLLFTIYVGNMCSLYPAVFGSVVGIKRRNRYFWLTDGKKMS